MVALAIGPIFEGDIGHVFDVNLERLDDDPNSATYGQIVPFDLTANGPFGAPSVMYFVFRAPPNNTQHVRTPSYVSQAGGQLRWTNTLVTDFPTGSAGQWRLQVLLTFATGLFRSSVVYFRVEPPL